MGPDHQLPLRGDDATWSTMADFRVQQRIETRDSTLVAGIVGLVALPIWAVFDSVLVPQ